MAQQEARRAVAEQSRSLCLSPYRQCEGEPHHGADDSEHDGQDLAREAGDGAPRATARRQYSRLVLFDGLPRSEERRVGKEWFSTFSTRGSHDHYKKTPTLSFQ